MTNVSHRGRCQSHGQVDAALVRFLSPGSRGFRLKCEAVCGICRVPLILWAGWSQVGDEIEEVYVSAAAFDPEAKEAEDFDTANTYLKFKVSMGVAYRPAASRSE